ncbi:MAG: tricarboxylate transporter [Paracoccus sp. (in: a-proteobacteria)]|uniref:tricarboxylate transporter n=1 Tax=unclassified Paracoccus (in: a-proteobacteria) TaxID=2688777 RepID=UPI000C5361B1|nr:MULTISPECIES: tricarboxylate transporter [unclassified Paracoccus (in: a-proteobacteria)]MAN56886.1 tricarboxylate transporter [Paracoccus sp. (in: a-proteobacteria)]|tara:strand:+ start:879 stop:1961 length:1083 start_codon:yes stop_codon:yes gene_type:complete
MKRSFILTAMAAAAVAAAAQTAAAQSFDGKTVEYTIPFSESGGSAQWANFYAPLLSEALPGAPTVVVRYRPGAGSTEGANWFQGQQDEGDGLTIFGDSGSTKFPYLLGDPRVRYEYRDWQPVLASATGGVVYLPPDLGERFDGDMDELKDEPYLYGSQGATTLDLVPLLAFKMLGMQVDPVFGVEGRGDGRLMFERGEANIDYQTSAAYLANVQPLVDDGLAVPIFTWGALDEQGNIVRDPTFPDLPSFKEVCEATAECETEGVAWDAYKAFFVAGFANQKTIFLPSSASQEVVDTYVKALREITTAEDFKDRAVEVLGAYPQLVGDAAVEATKQATSITPEAKQYVLDWLKEDYDITLE